MPDISLLDASALAVFLVGWIGYVRMVDGPDRNKHYFARAIGVYRARWIERMVMRPNRIGDAQLLGHVIRNVAFFSSTTILIVAALLGVLGTAERSQLLTSALPLAAETSRALWELKVIVLIGVFVYAFFKLSWSLRQFNYCCILVGAAPEVGPQDPAGMPAEVRAEAEDLGRRAARLANLGGHHFNSAMRAYNFGLAVLPWFVHPVLFMASTAAVLAMMWRRDFHSRTRKALTGEWQPGD